MVTTNDGCQISILSHLFSKYVRLLRDENVERGVALAERSVVKFKIDI